MSDESNEFRIALAELGAVLDRVDDIARDSACETLARAKRIGVYGCGREALQIKGFAIRLFHLGMSVWVVGDMTMPPLGEGDVFLLTGGPGELLTVTS
jgi:6-phospho-3-hexuloisomerase